MRTLILSFGLLLAGCGGGASTLGGSCTTACDCATGSKPLDCATGEWTCNDSSVCEYKCQNTCGGGGVGTCAFPATCDTAKGYCSQRSSCP